MKKKLIKGLLIVLGLFFAAAAAFVVYLTVNEFKPADVEDAELLGTATGETLNIGDELSILTWNIGYGGLDKNADFFMDGGKSVQSADEAAVKNNLDKIYLFAKDIDPDFYFFQEVDTDSKRSYGIDERFYMPEGAGAYAMNYSCDFVPFPLPPMGKVNSGLYTVHTTPFENAQRVSLPCPFKWPISTANIKRCLLISRIALRDPETGLITDKELVLVNLHLEAYDSGEGKLAQTKLLKEIITEEYKKGNYVIAGGDFNQSFPGVLDIYPIENFDLWVPGTLEENSIPDDWSFVCDPSVPTCRSLDAPYSEDTQEYVIDGFILSPNVSLENVETIDAGFENTDHNPVLIKVKLN